MFFTKQEDKMNEENETYNSKEITNNIKNGNYYTKEMLISEGFKEVDINSVNMNEKLVGPFPEKFNATEKVK